MTNTSESTTKQSVRYLALTALDKVFQTQAYSNLQLNQIIRQENLADADRRLLTNMVYGVIQHKMTLEYWLAPFIAGKKLDPWVNTLLLLSLYQYHYLDKVPDWAITDEAIKITKVKGHVGIRKLVTAILHNILRNGIKDFKNIQDPHQRLSIEFSVPKWIIEELAAQYGEKAMEETISSINQPSHQSVRVNLRWTTISDVTNQLEGLGFNVETSPVVPNALVVHGPSIADTALFKDGLVTMQDESAMLAVDSMTIKPSDLILDACAAPGGKTVQIAEQLDAKKGGQVTALDIHPHKIKLIKQTATRMDVAELVNAQLLDARQVDQQFSNETFDKILVDAPCSGIGLMRRKPEIRYDKTMADSQNLQAIQLNILTAVAPKIKKGGIITYSTCTILKQENEQVVHRFLEANPDFSLVETTTHNQLSNRQSQKTITVLPGDFDSDGFFVATIQKNQ